MNPSALDLAPATAMRFAGQFREKPEHAIYRLDQAFAKAGIPYHARADTSTFSPRFTVHVRKRDADRAQEAIAGLEATRA